MVGHRDATRYGQIAHTLRSRITDQSYPVGSTLPSVAELAGEFEVAEMTVKQALRILVEEGTIATARGVRARVLSMPSSDDSNATMHQQLSQLRQRVEALEELANRSESGHDTQ